MAPTLLTTDWKAHSAARVRVLRSMTVPESLREFLSLESEFADELARTDQLYRVERARALNTLQERLSKLNTQEGRPVKKLVRSVITLQARLDKAGIGSMVIGGMAVGVWGEPRLTRDIDMKVLLKRDTARRLIQVLGRGYRSLHGDAEQSFREAGFAFFLDQHGSRVDLLLSDNAFDDEALARAVKVELAPRKKARVCTAEDLVIYKLLSDRPRDRADAQSVIDRQGKKLDRVYVERWLRELGKAIDDSTLVAQFRRMQAR